MLLREAIRFPNVTTQASRLSSASAREEGSCEAQAAPRRYHS
jgi:hypothetical protein